MNRGTHKDITGNKYNRLTAKRLIMHQNMRQCWLFKCDCGVEKVIDKWNVVLGKVKSCGCYNRETARINIQKAIRKRKEKFNKLKN